MVAIMALYVLNQKGKILKLDSRPLDIGRDFSRLDDKGKPLLSLTQMDKEKVEKRINRSMWIIAVTGVVVALGNAGWRTFLSAEGENAMRPWELIVGIIGGGIISALVGWWSTCSTRKDIRKATRAFVSYLDGKDGGLDQKFCENEKGDLVVNKRAPISEQVSIGEQKGKAVIAVLKNVETGEQKKIV